MAIWHIRTTVRLFGSSPVALIFICHYKRRVTRHLPRTSALCTGARPVPLLDHLQVFSQSSGDPSCLLDSGCLHYGGGTCS